ncbi:MAG: hypothetical protein RLZZ350_749, partial [Verrucomicrobiota bacterium]
GNTALIGPFAAGDKQDVYGLANGYNQGSVRVISPYASKDLMEGGCGNGEAWISTFTYGRLWAAMLARSAIIPPTGSTQPYVVIRGLVDFGSNTVTLLPFVSFPLFSTPVAPTGNTHLLKVYLRNGATTNLAYSIPFTPDTPKREVSSTNQHKGYFTIPVACSVTNLVRVEIIRNPSGSVGGGVVAIRYRSASPPVIQLVSPNGGEVLGSSPLMAHWNASDADGDSLTYQVQFSPDGGQNWQTLAFNWPTNEIPLSVDLLSPSTNALLKVVASDGINSAASQSAAPFTVLNPALQMTTTSLPNGTNGANYNQAFNAYGGQPPYSWSLTPGSVPLPPGLTLTTNGTISGTSTNSGTFYFFVRVTDALSTTADGFFSVYIPPPLQATAITLTALNRIGNQFQMRLAGATGQNYTIQTSTNLSSTNWISLFVTNSTLTNSFIVTDSAATNKQRSYRVLVGP